MRTRPLVLSALAAALLSLPAAAQLPPEPRALASALQTARAPADLNAQQRALLDQLIAAVRASRGEVNSAVRARLAEFAKAYLHAGEDAKLTQIILYVYQIAVVVPDRELARAVGMVVRGETAADPAITRSYDEAIRTVATIMKQAYDDGIRILQNLKS